ncbi:uncharacterized protein LOC124128590 isoform X1 [Haliotis rufescens]|uniref:uncharacterized protein LOC124128590 isoform X1 n=1 Tax=Haliotis rufescens TaxID=6454 RepID=UPI00201EDBF3|nr:uncharacterized protein LOC124128590 isoform X1 [Haliotis rufescens]
MPCVPLLLLLITSSTHGQPGGAGHPPQRPPPSQGQGPVNCPQHPAATRHFYDSTTNKCYHFFDVDDTLEEAVSRCEAEDTRVVELGTKEEQNWLVREVCGIRGMGCRPLILWIGLVRESPDTWNWFYKSNRWLVVSPRWIHSPLSSSPGYTRAVTDRDGKWRAVTSGQKAKVVCEEVTAGDMPPTSPPPPPTPPATSPPPTQPATSPQKNMKTPSACAKVGREADDIAITNFEQLSSSVLVVEMNVTRRKSRLACAVACSRKQRCVMFKKQPGSRESCYTYSLSNTGSPADCAGSPPPCYWKSCWRPEL